MSTSVSVNRSHNCCSSITRLLLLHHLYCLGVFDPLTTEPVLRCARVTVRVHHDLQGADGGGGGGAAS